jgi:hypothetical protein
MLPKLQRVYQALRTKNSQPYEPEIVSSSQRPKTHCFNPPRRVVYLTAAIFAAHLLFVVTGPIIVVRPEVESKYCHKLTDTSPIAWSRPLIVDALLPRLQRVVESQDTRRRSGKAIAQMLPLDSPQRWI